MAEGVCLHAWGPQQNKKSEQAIAALLTTDTLCAAAEQIGVSERTLLRWLQDADFQRAYRDARRQVVQHAIVRVQRCTREAVDALSDVMTNAEASAGARVSAARSVLQFAMQAVQIEDLKARLAALERELARREEGEP